MHLTFLILVLSANGLFSMFQVSEPWLQNFQINPFKTFKPYQHQEGGPTSTKRGDYLKKITMEVL